jgi:hypothetical protein
MSVSARISYMAVQQDICIMMILGLFSTVFLLLLFCRRIWIRKSKNLEMNWSMQIESVRYTELTSFQF